MKLRVLLYHTSHVTFSVNVRGSRFKGGVTCEL